jgi:cell wall-associated NlpC family hydrolase
MRNPMKTRTLALLLSAVCSIVLFSCTPVNKESAAVKAALDSLRQHYAPDDRIAVFDLTVEPRGTTMVVKGDVDNPKAKDESLAAVGKVSGGAVIDSVTVLPDPQLGEKKFGILAVSVGNLRTKPGHPNELCTQAMMGTAVKLLKKRGGWYYVQLPDDYLGWIEANAMKITTAEGVDAWKSALKVIVTNYFALVRAQPTAAAVPVSDAVTGVLLKLLARKGGWLEVEIPDGRRGYIEAANVEEFETWKRTRKLTPENVEKTAKMFIGVPYLWGGTSPKGMDCSGFAKITFRLNGLELNRDADQQARMGEAIDPGQEFENLKKGDLLFFGRKATMDKPERITHVGIYLQKREFIHSPDGSGVKLNSFDPAAPDYSESLRKSFVRARRLIGLKQVSEVAKK